MQVEITSRPSFVGPPSWFPAPGSHQLQGTDGEKLCETAGRTCYDSLGAEKGRNSEEYAEHILEVGHGSVLEHAFYSFSITGVSRGLTHELVRHRVGVAYSQRSTRYVDESDSPWIVHPLMRAYLEETGDDELQAVWDQSVATSRACYSTIDRKLKEWLKGRGVAPLAARKQARGAARGALGNALETELVCSMNIRTILNVISQRANPHADAEIRELGCALVPLMMVEAPKYFSHIELTESDDGIGQQANGVRRV